MNSTAAMICDDCSPYQLYLDCDGVSPWLLGGSNAAIHLHM